MTGRLYEIAEAPQLLASWQNADGTQTIYLTSDPKLNVITLTLTNDLTTPVALPPGQPAQFGSLPPDQSAIYLFFNGLISNQAVEATSVAASGWSKPAFFIDSTSQFAYLVLAPESQLLLPVGGQLTFTLTGLTPTGQTTSGELDVYLAGAGIAPAQADVPIYVNVADPPNPANKSLDLVVGFVERDEVFTGASAGSANELLLFITNPASVPLVPGGHSAWGNDPPQFQLDLVCGSAQGALTDVSNAAQIAVNISDDYGNGWEPVAKHEQGSAPYWTMGPGPKPGTVLGTGESATVVISLSNIVTTLPQGLTYAYLSYRDIPGYDDGFFALEILKVNPIGVTLSASPNPVRAATSPTAVTLSFAAQNASYVAITGTDYAKPTSGVDFRDTAAAKIDTTTTFTLIAANYGTGQLLSKSVTVQFEAAPIVIESFQATPPTAAPGSSVQLSFSVHNATYVTIVNASYAKPASLPQFSDSVRVPVRTATSFTLLAFNAQTGQVASAALSVRVSPDPLSATTGAGIVLVDGHGNVTSSNGSPQFTVVKSSNNGYTVTFARKAFPGTTSPQMAVIPYGIAGHCVAPIMAGSAGNSNEWMFQVVLTATLPGLTVAYNAFTFVVVQPC